MPHATLSRVLFLIGCSVVEADPQRRGGGGGEEAPLHALVVPCQTPSGTMAALAVLSSGAGCPSLAGGGGARPRDCAVWSTLLEHPFACQPGAPLRRPDAQEASVFWLSGAVDAHDLTGASADRVVRWRCGEAAPQTLHGEVLVLQDDLQHTAEVELRLEDLDGIVDFTVCR